MIFCPDSPEEFIDARFYETTGSAFYASDDKLAGDYSPVRYTREIALLRRFCPSGRVLDVGCSTGGFLYHLRERFPRDFEVLGTDVASGALAVAESKGVPVLREDFFSLRKPPGGFDAITFWAVLEHVSRPVDFLRKAHELLAPDGHCFVLVPNIQSLAVKILGSKYRYILPQHLNYFSPDTLRSLVKKYGFRTVLTTTTHFNPVVILQDWHSRGQLVADRDRAALLVKTNALKSNPLLWPLRACYATAEGVLAWTGLADNVVIVTRNNSQSADAWNSLRAASARAPCIPLSTAGRSARFLTRPLF